MDYVGMTIYGADGFLKPIKIDGIYANKYYTWNDDLEENRFPGSRIEYTLDEGSRGLISIADLENYMLAYNEKAAKERFDQYKENQMEYYRKKEEERKIEEEQERMLNDFYGFENTMTKLQFGKIKKALLKLTRYENKIYTKKDFIVYLSQNGCTPEIVQYKNKKEYIARNKDRSYITLLKCEHDFLQYLINKA